MYVWIMSFTEISMTSMNCYLCWNCVMHREEWNL